MLHCDMPDDNSTSSTNNEAPASSKPEEMAQQPPPLPEAVTIPYQLVEGWLNIPAYEYVNLHLTRGDFDRLYGSLNKAFLAQSTFQQSMIDYSNGRLADANKAMNEAQRQLIEGQNDLRQLFSAIMASALQNRGSHGG